MDSQGIPPDLVCKLKDGAAGVRSAGEALTARVKAFETWLSRVPGRVPARCMILHDEYDHWETYLALERDGKDWALYLYDLGPESGTDPGIPVRDRKLLRDASIEDKALAVPHFKDLLEAMCDEQQALIHRANESAAAFDGFARSIGMKEGA